MTGRVFIAAALCAVFSARAQAFDITDGLTVTGYGDLRVVAPTDQVSWVKGGLGKLRYGEGDGNARFAEGVMQADATFTDSLSGVALLRAEPQTRGGVDVLETYLRYAPAASGDISWSVKAGAFFPAISLENDDIGWTSPYTLTPSAINSWVGDELRTIGSEAVLRWRSNIGTLSLTGAILCCNDEAGIVMADRGWSMEDRPAGLFERVRLPDATLALFHQSPGGRTGMFDEIDGTPGWYAGTTWEIPVFGKLTALRYDNEADPAAATANDTAWHTAFWSFGARTSVGPLVLIAQQLSGTTAVVSRGARNDTKFQSGFLLASYDLDVWRFSARKDLFQTRRVAATNDTWSEDGDGFTASASWARFDWLRLTGEVIAMHSRRGEYVRAGQPLDRDDTQFQFSTRFFY
ncbi:MAG TPA: hypothetical protein VHZ32_06120 [Rhizomicrobium sp.]|nr:hypothetical protein [Rhizomicrobium sp.]